MARGGSISAVAVAGPIIATLAVDFRGKRNSDGKTPMSEEKQADQRLTVIASSLTFQTAAAAAR